MIIDCFPELAKEIKKQQGNIYFQISILGHFTQAAIDNRDEAKFAKICRLFVQLFPIASPPMKNVLYVSFLEPLNFQDNKRHDRQWAYEQMPRVMRAAYDEIMDYLKALFSR